MKKSIIAAGAASVALAAMPVVGVFADTMNPGTVKDSITLNVESTCSVTATGTASGTPQVITNTIDFGNMNTATDKDNVAGTSMTINCNGVWNVKAAGAGSENGHETDLWNGTVEIDGDSTNGSYWQFKLGGAGSSYIDTTTTDYTDFQSIPSAATKVAGGNSANAVVITPTYKVHLSGDQAAGAYTGAISYQLFAAAN